MNPYENYYTDQAGSGLAAFEGIRYQRGHGIFGRMLSYVFPFTRLISKQALKTGINYLGDVVENRGNWKRAAKERLKEGAKEMALEGLNMARKFQQRGGGKRKSAKRKSSKSIKRAKQKSIKSHHKTSLFD